ncbi:MAG TPA: Ig-like domain-containing protein, partial [Longimicrobium sp.]
KLEKVSGDTQPGTAGAALPNPLSVKVTDTHGNAVAGALVNWSVSAGQANPAVSASDANGLAQTVWTVAAGSNTATATSGTLAAVSFTSVAPTDVRGIIASSTTWTRANSPYRITGVVQVAQGATLTIEPGVRVYPGGDSTVELFGSLRAQGTPESRITLDRILIHGRSQLGTAPEFTLAYADLTGGLVDAGNSVTRIHHNVFRSSFGISVFPGVAEVRVEDNEFRESIGVSSGASRHDVYIQRNLFVGSSGIGVTTNSEQGTFFIRSNSFYDLPANLGSLEFQALRVPGNVPIVLENNNFWSTNRVAVRLTSRFTEHVVNARNNFWNTTDPAVIAAMIVDRSDDLNITGRVEFTPFLTAPAPGAPVR